ncbi:hypothetical protein HYS31_06705 [Candidatus Woesearchaeota archaeon]|nr:hypothetical protein [Candidatus Woesearchaeota archaeon]
MGKLIPKTGKIGIGKKAIFFTFIAITIMALFIILFAPSTDTSLESNSGQALRARISVVDSYVSDLQNRYFEMMLRAATYKTALSLVFYMNATDSYLPNLDSVFQEVIINGTINKVPIDSFTKKKLMENSTLKNLSDKIIRSANDTLNVDTVIIIKNVSVFQTGPWNIDSKLNVNFSVKSNVAQWSKSAVVVSSVSIEGLYDPYYLVNTNGAYSSQIKRSSIGQNMWNITKVRAHLRNGTYVYWQNSNAPSFLMRLTNTITNSSCCGIESLVNPNKISPSDQMRSYVDYQFWGGSSIPCSQIYNITNWLTGGGLWDEFRFFKLDLNHTVLYNITAYDAVRAC